MANADDDVDFTAVMRQAGVAPVRAQKRGRGRAGGKGEASGGAASGAATDRSGPGAASKRVPGVGTSAGSVAPAIVSVANSGAKGVSVAARASVESSPIGGKPGEVARLVGALREAQARLAVVGGERDALAARVGVLERERDTLVHGRVRLTEERDTLERARARLERERDVDRPRLAATQAELTALREQLAAPRIDLAAALDERGVAGPDEQTRALALLAGGESGPRLLTALETRDVAGLRSALARRLALVCGDPQCAAPVGAAVLTVEPARCEVCGGSDIQRAAHRFARACAAAGVTRVRFVGGSPNYRTQLEALFPGSGPLTVRTTAGDRRVPLSQSKAQQRGDDLVIIWGATELDHATSGAYRPQQGRVETIAHRGIGRMLALAAERIGG